MDKQKGLIIIILIWAFSLAAQDFKGIDDFLSPEYMTVSSDRKLLYIGLSTYPGIAVYDLDSGKVQKVIPMPAPVSGLQLNGDNTFLFAGLRNDKRQVKVFDLRKGTLASTIETGYYPEDLVYSNALNLLIVANRFENSVSILDPVAMKEIRRLPTGREPYALALSGDQKKVAVAHLLPLQSSLDTNITARVSILDLNTLSVLKEIQLPNGSFGLKDIVYSPDGDFLCVSHQIARYNVPTNQIEKGWMNTNALSLIDVNTNNWYTSILLDDIYEGAANPHGMAFTEDGTQLLLCVTGTHELFFIDYKAMLRRIEKAKQTFYTGQTVRQISEEKETVRSFQRFENVEPMGVQFMDLPRELGFLTGIRSRRKLVGKGPRQVVITRGKAYVSSYFSDALEIVQLNATNLTESWCILGNLDLDDSPERKGEFLFHDAGHCFQHWQSCSSCHPGEGRVDALNWDLLNDGLGNPKNTKSLVLAHQTPPVMAKGIREDAETAVRAGFKYIQFFDVPEADAEAVDKYLKSLRPVPSPYLVKGKFSEKAALGQKIFLEHQCHLCHSGIHFTDQKQHAIGTMGKYDRQKVWDTPTLIELWRTAPYLHDGRYTDIADIFRIDKHGLEEDLKTEEVDALKTYLLSL